MGSQWAPFITSYIYCEKCREAVVRHLIDRVSENAQRVRMTGRRFRCAEHQPEDFSVHVACVAGQINTFGDVLVPNLLWDALLPRLALDVCHEFELAVLSDYGHAVYLVSPGRVESISDNGWKFGEPQEVMRATGDV